MKQSARLIRQLPRQSRIVATPAVWKAKIKKQRRWDSKIKKERLKCFSCDVVLVITWAPSKGSPRQDFVCHWCGLDEEIARQEGNKSEEVSPTRFDGDMMPVRLKVNLRRYMPNMSGCEDTWQNHMRFWSREWYKHGYKVSRSPNDWFQKMLNLYHRVPPVHALGLTPGGPPMTVGQMRERVKRSVLKVMPAIHVAKRHEFIKKTGGGDEFVRKSRQVEEFKFCVDSGQNFIDNPLEYSGSKLYNIEVVSLMDQPLKRSPKSIRNSKRKNNTPAKRAKKRQKFLDRKVGTGKEETKVSR